MTGQPVVAVEMDSRLWYEEVAPAVPKTADAPKTAGKAEVGPVLPVLQEIAERASTPEQVLIPFALRTTWVIAPETREDLNPDAARLTVTDVQSRGSLLMDVLRGLSPEQVRRLGSDAGLPVASLRPEQRALLERALRPPLKLTETRPEPAQASEPSFPDADDRTVVLDTAPDWSAVRMRARLGSWRRLLYVPDDKAMALLGSDFEPNPYAIDLSGQDMEEGRGLIFPSVPAFVPVANRLRPSDLSGVSYTAPIGIQGIHPMAEVLKRLSATTGLRLVADAHFRERSVFIGARAIPAGDVLEALALAFTGAWRKLGDTYILAWDRRGVAVVQRMAAETMANLSKALNAQMEKDTEEADRRLAMALPFDPEDPLALTEDQRQRLSEIVIVEDQDRADDDPMLSIAPKDGIPFVDMTPAQQDYFRNNAKERQMRVRAPSGTTRRPITESDLRHLLLTGDYQVALSLDLPGYGTVSVDTFESEVTLHRTVDAAEQRLQQAAEKAPAPWSLDAPMRGLIAPVLGPARLTELADEMARAGLTTLFYPVLFGGYATLPSKAFPLQPSLRGQDGWAAAVAAMKPKGIRVVGYMHTLAWQDAGDKPHWLDRHPDWLDLDVLGRPRLEWLSSLNKEHAATFTRWRNVRNYVRAREPQVAAKLRVLLDEFSERKDAAGLAFGEWDPPILIGEEGFPPSPGLGYALPDRLAGFKATNTDPVDISEVFGGVSVPLVLKRFAEGSAGVEFPSPHRVLLAGLIRAANAKRPDWKTYVLEGPDEPFSVEIREGLEGSTVADRPKPDFVLGDGETEPGGPGEGLLVTLTPRAVTASEAPEEVRAAASRMPALQTVLLAQPSLARRWTAVVLDFRLAPEEITDSLRWVQPPKTDDK